MASAERLVTIIPLTIGLSVTVKKTGFGKPVTGFGKPVSGSEK